MKKLLVTALLLVLGVATVFADQAAYISKTQAEKAAAFLKKEQQIRHYCSQCEDKGDRVESISIVKAEAVPDTTEGWWQVLVNGQGIDLAYVYFRTKKGKWKNLAMEMGIKVERVPKYLPAS